MRVVDRDMRQCVADGVTGERREIDHRQAATRLQRRGKALDDVVWTGEVMIRVANQDGVGASGRRGGADLVKVTSTG